MTLSFDIEGTGPTVVLLHAGVCDRRMWEPQWRPLIDAGARVMRCDLPGYGQTPMPSGPSNDADDVVELLDALGIESADIVGGSYGGKVALEIGARWPQRVHSLALLCAAMAGREPGAERIAFGAREDALIEAGDIDAAVALNVDFWLGPEADDATRDLVARMQRRAFEVQLGAPEFEMIEASFDLTAITAPVLAVSGAHDVADFREIATLLPELLDDARHVELEWAGHLPSMERPAAVTALLIDFLHETGTL
jgi:pimeloyl-ACP methyl ester carboxylesterase